MSEGGNLLALLALHRIAQMVAEGDNDDDSNGARISELEDESRAQTTLEQALELEAKSKEYMDSGKCEEAYGIIKKQYKLGPQASFIAVLANYGVSLIRTDRVNKVQKIRAEMIELIRDKLNCSSEEVVKYAIKLEEKRNYFEALLFYQIVADMCESENNPGEVTDAIQKSARGFHLITEKLFGSNQVTKMFVKQQILPYMYKISDR